MRSAQAALDLYHERTRLTAVTILQGNYSPTAKVQRKIDFEEKNLNYFLILLIKFQNPKI